MGDCSSKDATLPPLAATHRGIVHELYVDCDIER